MTQPDRRDAAIAFIQQMKKKSRLTQSEISRRSDGALPQRTISRLENDPFSTSVDNLSLYLRIIGSNLSDLENFVKSATSHGGKSLCTYHSEIIESSIAETISKLRKAKDLLNSEESAREILMDRGTFSHIDSSIDMVNAIGSKPIIGFYGLFDSAKSTVINCLLGSQWMPEGYQPETSIVNIIAHTTDKPEWLIGDVAVFKQGFNPNLLNDQSHAKSLLVEQGSKDILQKLGRHQYLEGSEDHKEAAISMVFVNSEAVEGVWFMDTPGDLNSTDENEEDRRRAESSLHFCDGVVFMSPVTGFLSGPSLAYFNAILKSIPPLQKNNGGALDHVRIVMSHAHAGVSDLQITDIKQKIRNNFRKFSDGIFNYWKEVEEAPLATSDEFISCISPFYREDKNRLNETIKNIKSLAEYCQKVQEERVFQKTKQHTLYAVQQMQRIKLSIESDMRSCKERIEEAESNYLRFRNYHLKNLKDDAQKIIEEIRETSANSQDDVSAWIRSNTTAEALEEYIYDNFSDKKQAQNDAPAMIMSRIDQYVSKRMKRDSKNYAKDLDRFLAEWEVTINSPTKEKIDIDGSITSIGGFDARSSMLAGIVGLGSYGAMAAYVATLGNLGGYIIGAKLAGLLVSAGLITDVTVVSSAIAFLGGPVTIMLGLSLLIAGIAYKIFGDRWQKILAKDLKDKLEDEDIVAQITENISAYWHDTEKAFKAGVLSLEKDSEIYYSDLRKKAKEQYDVTCLQAAASLLDNACAAT